MNEYDLMVDIAADPDSDLPRLAHAAWLEANGDPDRARFIRAQLSGEPVDAAPFAARLPQVKGMEWRFSRGYPERAVFRNVAAFRAGWPVALAHGVRQAEFHRIPGGVALAKEPGLAEATSFTLWDMHDKAILDLLASPHLGPLRELSLQVRGDARRFFRKLARLPLLARVESLRLEGHFGTGVEADDLAAFADSPHVAGLRRLHLSSWGFDELDALWRSSGLRSLVELRIWAGVSSGSMDGLGDGSAFPALERLGFCYGEYGGDAGLAVARAVRLRLRTLDLSSSRVGDEGATALAGAAHLAGLEELRLGGCSVSDAGASALARSHLSRLRALGLRANMIGRAGIAALGRSVALSSLRSLDLEHNPAPEHLLAAVVARFRDGAPPLEEEREPARPAIVSTAPVVGDADEDGLLRAILADPWDELPRLAYADWLEERGAEVQAALLRATPQKRASLSRKLKSRMEADAPCASRCGLTGEDLVRVSISPRSLRSKAFGRDGPAWLRRHHAAEVRIDGDTADWKGLFAAGWLEHARGVESDTLDIATLEELLVAEGAEKVASLWLGGQVRILEDRPWWAESRLLGLCRLELPQVWVSGRFIREMSETAFAPNLRRLSLTLHPVEQLQVATALVNNAALDGLVTLSLRHQILAERTVKMLAEASGLSSLRNLELFWISPLASEALASSGLPRRLHRLQVESHDETAMLRLARAVADSPRCRLVLEKPSEEVRDILGDRLVS